MKDVMVLCYEGNVRIDDVPNCISKERIIEEVRCLLQDKLNKLLVDLYNVEYYKNDEIYKYLDKSFGDFCDTPEDFYDVRVSWSNIS